MASTLSGPNVEEEHMWAVTLSGTKREYEWAPEDPSDNVDANESKAEDSEDEDFDPACKPNHRLLIKSAILHPDAKKDEVTMIQVETTGYKNEKVVTPFLAMQKEHGLQQYVNLLLPDAAKIKIISGDGPVTLVGSHCVDFYDYRNYGTELDDEEEAESSEDDEVDEEMEEQETAAEVKEDKSEDKTKAKTKASKMDVEAEAEPKEKKKKTPKKGSQSEEDKSSEAADKKTPKKSEDEGTGGGKKKTPKKSPAAEKAEPMQESPADKKSPDKKRKASGDSEDTKKKRKGSAEK